MARRAQPTTLLVRGMGPIHRQPRPHRPSQERVHHHDRHLDGHTRSRAGPCTSSTGWHMLYCILLFLLRLLTSLFGVDGWMFTPWTWPIKAAQGGTRAKERLQTTEAAKLRGPKKHNRQVFGSMTTFFGSLKDLQPPPMSGNTRNSMDGEWPPTLLQGGGVDPIGSFKACVTTPPWGVGLFSRVGGLGLLARPQARPKIEGFLGDCGAGFFFGLFAYFWPNFLWIPELPLGGCD